MRLLLMLALVACGRIGYDEHPIGGNADDAAPPVDVPVKLPGDGRASCPPDTTPIANDAAVCVEKTERGNDTWTNAKAICEGLGRRLCADAEWATACDKANGLVDMANDEGGTNPNWEWVADLVAPDVAAKRGSGSCDDESSHEIFVDPYDYRCCLDL